MSKSDKMKQNSILREKRKKLNQAKTTLCSEFIGLETIIDEIVNTITPWYLMPEWHKSPLVVNLWGLTGTGKTSLVTRLSELIDFNDRTFQINLSQSSNRDVFNEIKGYRNGEQMILIMDEFQLFRTIDEDNKETKQNRKQIWDLIDCGKYQDIDFPYCIHDLREIILKMHYMLSCNVRVKNGIVQSHFELYKELFESHKKNEYPEPLWFFPKTGWPLLAAIAQEYILPTRWVNFCMHNSAIQQIQELERVIKIALQPQEVNCSKALIFVIGNLDEAFGVSNNMRSDLHADAFHEETKQIGVYQIKNALLTRFRPEQIARLGNLHIIYPALSSANFRLIIKKELEKIQWEVGNNSGVYLTIDNNVVDFLYNEGVYPAQGVRPLLSTIKSVLLPAISHFVLISQIKKERNWLLVWDSINNNWLFTGGKYKFIQEYRPETTRFSKDPILEGDKKLIAVHEAGHVLGMITLLGEIPDYIYNNTHTGSLSGEVHFQPGNQMQTLDNLINHVAMVLGGWVAEGHVFGKTNRTTGSENDLFKATCILLNALKTAGVDEQPYFWRSTIEPGSANRLYDGAGALDSRAKSLLDIARTRMEESLEKNPALFRNLVVAIDNKQYLFKKDIESILIELNFEPIISQKIQLSNERDIAFNKLMEIESRAFVKLQII